MALRILAMTTLVYLCIVSMIDAFSPQSTPRLGFPLSRRLVSVTRENSLAGSTGVSLVKLFAGLKKDEEEEYFESDVSVAPWSGTSPLKVHVFTDHYHSLSF